MTTTRRKTWVVVGFVLFAGLMLLALVPQRYVPDALTSFRSRQGSFAGQRIHLLAPENRRPDLPATIALNMDRGACRVGYRQGTTTNWLFSMGQGRMHARIPSGAEMVLDPQSNTGAYNVTLGLEWHPLAPKTRRFVYLPMALSAGAGFLFAGRMRPQVSKFGVSRVVFLAGVGIFSGLILYPVIHEGGHMLFGILLGATPNWDNVVWTSLGGEEPHASFLYLPPGADPVMSAGGALLPTLFALLLLAIWALVRRRLSWHLSAVIVAIPVFFLFSTLGCVFELSQNSHMDALSVHLGFSGLLRVLVSLSPLIVAAAAYTWLGSLLWRARAPGAGGQMDRLIRR